MYYTTLDLGEADDARSWEKGCQSLGLKGGTSIMALEPDAQHLCSFFGTVPDWTFLSGHYQAGEFWGETKAKQAGALMRLQRDRVSLWSGGQRAVMIKGQGFRMHTNLSLLVWGACSACADPAGLRMMRELFDNPTILGYTARSGWKITNAMLGGGFLRAHFFEQLRHRSTHRSADFVSAWLGAAKAGYGGSPMEGLFCAVDNEGQTWRLRGGEIVPGVAV